MKLLLVEDEIDLATILQRTLVRENYLVDWVENGQLAWDCLEHDWTQYCVAIVDWMLPQLSGIELCRRLRQKGISLPVLMLTAKDQMEDMVEGLDAGADDYLVKPFAKVELLARLRALQRRSPQVSIPQLQHQSLTLDYASSSLRTCHGTATLLTPGEFRLMEYFIKHPNQILNRDQILSHCWEEGGSHVISNVLASQIRILRRKLADLGYGELIETVRGFGYRLRDEL